MLKILDKLLVKEFIPAMIMATIIAVFVLVMQNLWLYIDEIMGKGISFWEISEMFAYMSISFLPLAMPVGILISSVMLFGNLGERYELSSIKSAGVSLFRIMQPVIFACFGIAIFSFFCSNNLIPYTNLKFQTKLFDIRKQKPALNLQEGVFNYDFEGYAIKIGQKDENGQNLKDVMIYDHSNTRRNEVNIMTADRGKMFTTPNEQYLVMELYDGYQYQEMQDQSIDRSYPVMRSNFDKFIKTFDLSEFTMTRTNEEVFKKHENMLNVSQLTHMIDSMKNSKNDIVNENVMGMRLDTSRTKKEKEESASKRRQSALQKNISMKQIDSLRNSPTFLHRFSDPNKTKLISRAISKMRYHENRANSLEHSLKVNTEKISKYTYQKHNKYALAIVCVIFLFIGAPMGAIVRKGGFGYPMLIAILFFMLFIVITLFSEAMVDKARIDAVLGAWMACLILFPIGVFLTIKASNDSKFIDIDAIQTFFLRLIGKKSEN